MVRHVDAIFSHGTFHPCEPLALPEGTRVRLHVEEQGHAPVTQVARIHTPRLAHLEEAADFVMEVRETGDASV
jgi:predicted DNA-binding antitoxin AbrB/MazE fold protein